MKDRPLPAPPRPPRDKRRRKTNKFDNTSNKFDRGGGGERMNISLSDMSPVSSQEVEETEIAIQTDPLPEDFLCDSFEITDDMPRIEPSHNYRDSRTIGDILRDEQGSDRQSEQNLARGIQKFREANQRTYSERSRASTDGRRTPLSRPITPSAIVIEQRIVHPTTETDATLIVQPLDEEELQRLEITYPSGSIAYADDAPYIDYNITTEEERIVNEAIRRYQMMDRKFRGLTPTPPVTDHEEEIESEQKEEITEKNIEERDEDEEGDEDEAEEEDVEEIKHNAQEELAPQPPPRRKSSASEAVVTTTATIPLVKCIVPSSSSELVHVSDQQQISSTEVDSVPIIRGGRLQITDLEVQNLSVGSLQAGRILVSELQGGSVIADDLECKSGSFLVRGVELPTDFIQELVNKSQKSNKALPSKEQKESQEKEPEIIQEVASENRTEPISETLSDEQPPERPPPPQPFYPSEPLSHSVPPAAFFQLRTGDSDEELRRLTAPVPPRKSRRHYRRHDLSSDEEYQRGRRSHHETQSTIQPSISNLAGQLIRACGNSIGATIRNTGQTVTSVLRGASSNQDEKRRDVNLVLIILIVIIAVLMMIGMSGDHSVHHHHWDYFNPPDNIGRQ